MYKVIRYSRYRLPEVYSEHSWWIVAQSVTFLANLIAEILDVDPDVYFVEKSK